MESVVDDDDETISRLKSLGNEAFGRKDYRVAEKYYTEALEVCPSAKLYSNRSASRMNLGKAESALADAELAIQLEPNWVKAHHRKALAYVGLQQYWRARFVYENAIRNCVGCQSSEKVWMLKQIKKINPECEKSDLTDKVESFERWVQIYRHIRDKKLRLACLVFFWNMSTKAERHTFFGQFLKILQSMDAIKMFSLEQMNEFPIDNYEDVVLPSTWTVYYSSLSSEQKVELFEECFALLTSDERDLVIKDLKFFFLSKISTEEVK